MFPQVKLGFGISCKDSKLFPEVLIPQIIILSHYVLQYNSFTTNFYLNCYFQFWYRQLRDIMHIQNDIWVFCRFLLRERKTVYSYSYSWQATIIHLMLLAFKKRMSVKRLWEHPWLILIVLSPRCRWEHCWENHSTHESWWGSTFLVNGHFINTSFWRAKTTSWLQYVEVLTLLKKSSNYHPLSNLPFWKRWLRVRLLSNFKYTWTFLYFFQSSSNVFQTSSYNSVSFTFHKAALGILMKYCFRSTLLMFFT